MPKKKFKETKVIIVGDHGYRGNKEVNPLNTFGAFYGFKKTNGSGSQKEDLILTKTAGTDNISVANNDGTQSDLYDESFLSKSGLTFTVNSDGELLVTI